MVRPATESGSRARRRAARGGRRAGSPSSGVAVGVFGEPPVLAPTPDETANDESIEEAAPGTTVRRDALDCDPIGITVVDGEDGWIGTEHDHADEGHEAVYLLRSGSAELTVEGNVVDLEAGDAVRVDPNATRQRAFDVERRMVVAGAS